MINISTKENKKYQVVNISEDPSIFATSSYREYTISSEVMRRLSKDIGFSYDLYTTLLSISSEAADSLVKSMSKKSEHQEITLLIDTESLEVIAYSLEAPRTPLLNNEFIQRSLSLVESSPSIEISEIYYLPEDTISSIIVKKIDPITIEEKYEGRDSKSVDYQIGVLLVNDETTTTYSRLVLYIEGQPVYLPSSYYNATTSRYRRSTNSSSEAIEVLLLKVIDDLRDTALSDKLYEFHFRYRANKSIVASYEEYSNLLRVMRKIPTIIDDNSVIDSLLHKYENFERRYIHLADKKNSYIWRCTALGDITIGALVSLTSEILTELNAPAIEYFGVRDLLGNYISTSRIASDIAMESIE